LIAPAVYNWSKQQRLSSLASMTQLPDELPAPDCPAQDGLSLDLPVQDKENRGALIERIFREHNASLLRFLQARLSSAQDAREVAQEAYVRLLQLDSPGAIGFLRAYLFKTAANLATDRLRHRRVTQLNVSEDFFNLEPPTPMDTLAAQQDLEILSAEMPRGLHVAPARQSSH
jgi:RNA polymerase sigma-70 factor (ECF subfamily)